MDDLPQFPPLLAPTAQRPLMGLTVLVVEDSRFACEAMRLLCLKSGARIRRADTLAAARKHLRTYRPSVIIVDLGLPDGSGLDLIRDLRRYDHGIQAILATSGDDTLAHAAIQAGANGFLCKPLTSVGAFQQAIQKHIAATRLPPRTRAADLEQVSPDALPIMTICAKRPRPFQNTARRVSWIIWAVSSLALRAVRATSTFKPPPKRFWPRKRPANPAIKSSRASPCC